eukprot:2841294-Rhodomonas_salina.3
MVIDFCKDPASPTSEVWPSRICLLGLLLRVGCVGWDRASSGTERARATLAGGPGEAAARAQQQGQHAACARCRH